jgi:hypothetical protein
MPGTKQKMVTTVLGGAAREARGPSGTQVLRITIAEAILNSSPETPHPAPFLRRSAVAPVTHPDGDTPQEHRRPVSAGGRGAREDRWPTGRQPGTALVAAADDFLGFRVRCESFEKPAFPFARTFVDGHLSRDKDCTRGRCFERRHAIRQDLNPSACEWNDLVGRNFTGLSCSKII